MKNEPAWMRDFRLKALDVFWQKPTPTWGGELADLNFDDIHYYMKAADRQGKTWDDVPAEIKNTFDKLGIPEAEREVPRRRRRPVRVGGRLPQPPRGPPEEGRHLRRHRHGRPRAPRPGPRVLRHDHPDPRQQVRRAELGGLVGRLVRLHPGRA